MYWRVRRVRARRWVRLRKYRAVLLRGHPARVCYGYAPHTRSLPFTIKILPGSHVIPTTWWEQRNSCTNIRIS
ncbi:hypothetical protein JG688_00012280 [Phytophthora aleatoria]|uniref:Uncharacterized protein n=1 Tax=Phytophthora aleatoria TaxID=2496075 RepID=A0A8J5IKM4_9STRA|nr:hypothetical protein JG688_00012280 [Phytophthora aleatoria]